MLFAFAVSAATLLTYALPAQAASVTIHSARIVDGEIRLVVTSDVDHSCFLMRNSAGEVRSQFGMCLPIGVQQPFSMQLEHFPGLVIGDTLVLETIVNPMVTTAAFQFTGDLSLQSVRLVGGTQVEVVYTQSFPACSLMHNQSGTVISRTSSAFCQSGSNITTLLDREANFTNIQPGQSVSLGVISRSDLVTNTVVVGSAASPLPCVMSTTSLNMLDRSAIVANQIYVEDFLSMNSDSTITGSVFGRDDGRMDIRSRINGNLSLIGTLVVERGTVTGLLRENYPVPQLSLTPGLVFDSTPNYTVPWDQSLTLPPGRYGTVIVQDRARLRLEGAGAYSFSNLSFASDAKLELTTLQGEFNIEVDDSLVFGERFSMRTPSGGLPDGSRVFFYTNATTLNVPFDVILRGQLWAPNATVVVRDRAQVKGCTRAKGINLGYDSRILEN